jgi:hypothetical protein
MEQVVLPGLPKNLLPPPLEIASKADEPVEVTPRVRPDMMEFLSEKPFLQRPRHHVD